MLNQGWTPVHLTSFFVGDRTPVRALSIADGVLTADLTIHDADDPFCCPTLEVTWQFVLQGGELAQVEE